MKKHLANVEKAWSTGALAMVKEELSELSKMSREVERVIKNQLYSNLKEPRMELEDNGEVKTWEKNSQEES